jgi:hypothetical protein
MSSGVQFFMECLFTSGSEAEKETRRAELLISLLFFAELDIW